MLKNRKRFIYMVLLGVVITLLLNFLIPGKFLKTLGPGDFLSSILITIVVWEGNLRIDHWLNRKFPWLTHPAKRILSHFAASVGFSSIVIFLGSWAFNTCFNGIPLSNSEFFNVTLVILGVLVLMSVFLLTIEISTQFFRHWKTSLVEVEKYRAESLQAQLQNLKNQINPHFLFNNMSVLSSLVYKDPDKAVEFINQLSKVYRYLLDTQRTELVSVEDELQFLRSYLFLLRIRFGANLSFTLDIRTDHLRRLIPPMALQILIENAIKHNEASSERPLVISIHSEADRIVVTNTLQLRPQHEPGSRTGLQNIRERYRYYTEIPVEIIHDERSFCVKIPLLSAL